MNQQTNSLQPDTGIGWQIQYFSNKRLINNGLLILGLLLINKAGTAGNLLCYFLLTVLALKNTEWALKALSVSGLIIIASDVLVSRGGLFPALKFWLLLIAGLTILRESRRLLSQPHIIALLLFSAIAALLTLVNGYYIGVSLLKNAMFTFGTLCLLSLASYQKNIGIVMTEWVLSLIYLIVTLSFVAYVLGVGHGVFENIWGARFSGFRGITSHPQTMGMVGSFCAVYLTAIYLFYPIPNKKQLSIMLLSMLMLVYLSEARTGLLGYFLAVFILLLLSNISRISPYQKRFVSKNKNRLFNIGVLLLILLAFSEVLTGQVSNRINTFLAKGKNESSSLTEAFEASRQGQIDSSMETFREHPYIGIGFGTDDTPAWRRKATLLSASTEKGFLPAAILEEVGIIGTACFVIFLVATYLSFLGSGLLISAALLTSLLVLNIGEMMFFAYGGMGMFLWCLLGISLTKRT